ncbi:MAG TPA: nitroreductase family deazaflavin-dependent oxidoreductase [Candidatus Dormibacteraeota bacterium]|jgi:deazaflavin-dependent oxidoreductase (nitroreductase family)|nr:nitroreductase family deazaflavin-dependent oxidoreductase [Candidatus Dormibacteraeota bacterium]
MSLLARLTASGSQFLNERGIYLGWRSTRLHVALYRRTGGRIGGHLPGWPDVPIMLLDHRGARSGARRTSPLMFQREGDSIVVAASKAGQATNPAWFHNLVAHPETTIQIGPEVRPVLARVATDEERGRLWSRFVLAYPGYEFYRRHAGRRRIPIVILDPHQPGFSSA